MADKSDDLAFLDEDAGEEGVQEQAQEAEAEQPREPANPAETETPAEKADGPEPDEQPEAQSAPAAEPEQPKAADYVPLATFLDMRDKFNGVQAQLSQLRQQQQPEPEAPDPIADPEGYHAFMNDRFGDALYQQSLGFSHRFAVQQHGEEAVNEAVQWAYAKCGADPLFNEQVRRSDDPVGFAVQQFSRDRIASTVTPEQFDLFLAWQQAQQQVAAGQTPAAQQQQPTQPKPPKSIASMPGAGGTQHVAVHDGAAFDEVFKE